MIKIIEIEDLKPALNLVNDVFAEFVAVGYSQEGKDSFESYLINKYEEVASGLKAGDKKLWGYYKDDAIVGVIGTRDGSHISLMFVDKKYHKQGIARELFNTVLADIQKNDCNVFLTVNSSPYAVIVYEHLGFTKTSEQQEKNGMIFIPMQYKIEVKIKGIYKHFKGDYYLVEDIAINSETDEKMVVYRKLYEDASLYVRPYDMFLERVDKEKYPEVTQEYRFELQDIKSIRSN